MKIDRKNYEKSIPIIVKKLEELEERIKKLEEDKKSSENISKK
jgi:hypothetical protein